MRVHKPVPHDRRCRTPQNLSKGRGTSTPGLSPFGGPFPCHCSRRSIAVLLWMGLMLWLVRSFRLSHRFASLITIISPARLLSLQTGRIMPCVVLLYLHTVLFVLYPLPYLLRGLRAVIVSHDGLRQRFLKYLKRGRISAFLIVAFLTLLGVCATLQQLSPQLYG